MQRVLCTIALLAAVGLAGCASDEPAAVETADPEDPFAVQEETGVRDLRTDLTEADAAPSPPWALGDWFGHHIFFGADDTAGQHVNTIVVGDAGSDWILATDDPLVAKWEAAWDFPMLGNVAKNDLSTTAFAGDWGIYQFPMAHGNTWTTSIDPLFNGVRDVTISASFNPEISTPYGIRPGFDLIGVNEDGDTELVTDYVPEIGWYSRLTLFDTSTPAEDDFILDIISMGRGNDWTGDYVVAQANPVLIWQGYVTPFDAPGSSPPHHETVTIGDSTDELYGLIVDVAVVGASHSELIDPSQGRHEYQAMHTEPDTDGGETLFEFIEIEGPQTGDWQFVWGGAGAFSLGVVFLWEITYETTTI